MAEEAVRTGAEAGIHTAEAGGRMAAVLMAEAGRGIRTAVGAGFLAVAVTPVRPRCRARWAAARTAVVDRLALLGAVTVARRRTVRRRARMAGRLRMRWRRGHTARRATGDQVTVRRDTGNLLTADRVAAIPRTVADRRELRILPRAETTADKIRRRDAQASTAARARVGIVSTRVTREARTHEMAERTTRIARRARSGISRTRVREMVMVTGRHEGRKPPTLLLATLLATRMPLTMRTVRTM
jgi:hypothetical protein